jgi:hypothetical protein
VIRRRIAGGILAAAASELAHSNRRPGGRGCKRARKRILLSIKPVRQIVLRAVALLASCAVGLVVAAWIVPGVSLSVWGFIVAVVVFSVAQAILSLSILKLPRQYASLLLGGTGLALTIVALILASLLTHGLTIDGMAPWVATTVVVWLVTTIGAITLPELLIRDRCRCVLTKYTSAPTDLRRCSDDGGSGDGRHA